MGTLEQKWGPNGDPKTEKGPHGDRVPQMGTHLGAVYLYLDGIDMVFWQFHSKKQPNRCAVPFLRVRYMLVS